MRRITIALALALVSAGAAACSDDSSSVLEAAEDDTTTSGAPTSTSGAPTSTAGAASTTWPSTTLSTFPATTAAPTTTRPAPATCSAMGMSRELPPQPGLPAPVAATRQAIVDAAVACDWDALRALTSATSDFTATFGGDEPVGYWQNREDAGDGALRAMVIVLRAPFRAHNTPNGDWFTWPDAFDADPLTEAHRAPIAELYTKQDFDSFRELGGYVGHRAVIMADGTWKAFVQGD